MSNTYFESDSEDAAIAAGPHVDLVDDAPDVGDVEEAVIDQRRRFDVFVGRHTAQCYREGELEILDVGFVDDIQWREPTGAVIVVIHQPVLRLRIEEALVADIGSACAGCAQQSTD